MNTDASSFALGDLVVIKRGITYKSRLLGMPGPVLLGLSSIQRNGGFRADSLRTYGGDSPDEILVSSGELYASLKDVTQSADLLGAVARLPESIPMGRLTQDTVKLRLVAERVSPSYLYWILRTPEYRSYCRAHAIGTTNLSLSREDFLAFRVPYPTHERLVLVDILDALDDKIALNSRLSATYESILRLEFARLGIDEEPLGGEGFVVEDLVALNPITAKPDNNREAVYVDMASLPTDSARIQRWARRLPRSGARFLNGDALLARITPCLENGKAGYVDFMEDGEVGTGSTEFIVLRARPGVPSQVAYFLTRSPRFRAHAVRNMSGSSGRQRVSADVLATFPLIKPDTSKLIAFGELAARVFAHIKSLDQEARYLGELRDALLPKLMSGEIRVRDAEQAVEAAT